MVVIATPDIQIDPEFQSIIPPLTAEEKDQLETQLLADGCRDHLIVWRYAALPDKFKYLSVAVRAGTEVFCRNCGNDSKVNIHKGSIVCSLCNGKLSEMDSATILIDGHNRFEICQKHGIEFQTVEMHFCSREEAKAWIIRNQFGRRNLSAFQRAELALKLEPLLKPVARDSQLANLKQSKPAAEGENSRPREISPKIGVGSSSASKRDGKTDEKLAVMAGVSSNTIRKARVIANEGSEEVKEQIRAKKLSINKAYEAIRPPKPTEDLISDATAIENFKVERVDARDALAEPSNSPSTLHFRETLNAMTTDSVTGSLTFTQRCHPGAPVKAGYRDGEVLILCDQCGATFARIAVASQP